MAVEAAPLDPAAAEPDDRCAVGAGAAARSLGGLAVAACAAVAHPARAARRWTTSIDRADDPAGAPAASRQVRPNRRMSRGRWLRDLPLQLDEPLALTYNLNDEGSGYRYRAVSASGRQWTVPRMPSGPSKPVPGRMADRLARHEPWMSSWFAISFSGVEHRIDTSQGATSEWRWSPSGQTTMPWSPDGAYSGRQWLVARRRRRPRARR